MTSRFEWYAGEDAPSNFVREKKPHKPTKLRGDVKPGQVLILLSGRFRGKRVVFLKQLESGLLLVTGPYKVNGVPIKRVNQAYTIATSTTVNIAGADFAKITDYTFKKDSEDKASGESKFFAADKPVEKKVTSEDRKNAQKSVDTAITASLKTNPLLRKYLSARFTLTKHSRPHAMKF